MRHKIIIDTDPGQDDAVAILLALGLAWRGFEVLGDRCGGRQCSVQHNANNALQIVELAGHPEAPVYVGCAGPMRAQAGALPNTSTAIPALTAPHCPSQRSNCGTATASTTSSTP